MGTFAKAGCEISYWAVHRMVTDEAYPVAKATAEEGKPIEKYIVVHGSVV